MSYGDALDAEFKEVKARAQKLEAELLHAQAQVNPLEREVERLEQKISQLTASSASALAFNQSTGAHIDQSTGIHYCTRCLSDGKRNPLKNEDHGWRCMVCKTTYSDPERPWPEIQFGGGPLA